MHIYIHIPFCNSKCPYCAFGSHTDKFKISKQYFKALEFEISNFVKNNNEKISTIFIGGGTPSSIDANFYESIFDILRPNLKENFEITSEANPNSASKIWLKKMKDFGVNRISFGAQSFDEKKLKFLGRTHNKTQIITAVQNAKEAGFKNINTDIIYSTKLDNKALLDYEISNLKELDISHISAYSLTLEENTPFFNKTTYKKDSVFLAKYLFKKLEDIGFNQYEISNFGQICKHNLAYWNQENYAGFGAYAVGFIKNKRFYSPKNIEQYLQNPTKKEIENLSDDDKRLEHIFLGARSILGICKNKLKKDELEKAILLQKEEKLIYENEKFYNKDFLLADEIALFITS